jgi:hypothetical protein
MNFIEKSMEKSMKIPWNSMENFHEKNPSSVYEKFYGIPWKLRLMEFHSMEFREFTEFHGIRFRQGILVDSLSLFISAHGWCYIHAVVTV